MVLVVDVGNSRAKAAVFEHGALLETFAFDPNTVSAFALKLKEKYVEITHLVHAGVAPMDFEPFFEVFSGLTMTRIDRQSRFPFKNDYATPETLGLDRMVLASGAVLKFPSRNRLVIDAGTCITFDVITADDVYMGGAIGPGIQMRYRAMNTFTSALPMLTPAWPEKGFIGQTTAESMHIGAAMGAVREVASYIEEYEKSATNFIIILTGGDSEFLAKRLKNTIFANPNFLLEGLYATYQYILND